MAEAATGAVTRTAGPVGGWRPADNLHPEWMHLNCMYICKGSAEVDAGKPLWHCHGCRRKWHESCAYSSQDIDPSDPKPGNNVQWWCDLCDYTWNDGYAKGRKDAMPPRSARKSDSRPQAIISSLVNPLPPMAGKNQHICDVMIPATKKNPARICGKLASQVTV